MNWFVVFGPLAAAWAVVLSVLLGLRRPDFPRTRSAERAVIGISILLVALAIGSAITGANHRVGEREGPPAKGETAFVR
ncbi:MAG: hypothetical protein IRZ21_02540 [Thermoleophilaceae bacterium]|nr:hypothetical protein [Thermoleophilaceae bacterium]